MEERIRNSLNVNDQIQFIINDKTCKFTIVNLNKTLPSICHPDYMKYCNVVGLYKNGMTIREQNKTSDDDTFVILYDDIEKFIG